jgi:hypothetical protein
MSVECDRMMALMPCKVIYLVDVCLLAMLLSRRVLRVAFGVVRPGAPQKSSLARAQSPFARKF